MNVDIDTRKMELKKGDILVHDGKKFVKTTKKELFAEAMKEIKEIKDELIPLKKLIKDNKKYKKFIKKLGGVKVEKD